VTAKATPPAPLALVLVIALALPLASVLIYRAKGTPQAMDPALATAPAAAAGAKAPEMEKAIEGPAAPLKAQPALLTWAERQALQLRTFNLFRNLVLHTAAAIHAAKPDPGLPVPVATQAVCGADPSVATPLTSTAKNPAPGPVHVLPPLSERRTPSRVVPARATAGCALSSASARTLA